MYVELLPVDCSMNDLCSVLYHHLVYLDVKIASIAEQYCFTVAIYSLLA